jgi:hypothetical protein
MKSPRSNGLRAAVCIGCLPLLALGTPRTLGATTIHVPSEHPTIQQAIAAAVDGDTVLVAPGTYFETIDFDGKTIVVASDQGPDTTIINARGAGSAVTFRSRENRGAVLSGFTIRGGFNNVAGGGIYIANSSPTIRGNFITANHSCTGAGIYSSFGSPLIEENTIIRNASQGCSGGWGIGIYVGGDSAVEIVGNVISDNTGEGASGGGVALFAAGSAVLSRNVIARNATAGASGCGWGGGVAIANFVQATIVNNVVFGNSACYGGGMHWRGSTGRTTLVNNTITDNDASSWPGVYATGVDARNRLYNNIITSQSGPALSCENASSVEPPVLDSNDVFSAHGSAYGGTCVDQQGLNGNRSVSPGFVDSSGADYRMASTSAVVDAGNNSAPHIPATDLTGHPRTVGVAGGAGRIDMGAYEYVNHPPMLDAGVDQTVTAATAGCFATATLNAAGEDADGDVLTFMWTGSFGTVAGPKLSVPLPSGRHVITLTVTDGNSPPVSDSVVVTVLDPTAPITRCSAGL